MTNGSNAGNDARAGKVLELKAAFARIAYPADDDPLAVLKLDITPVALPPDEQSKVPAEIVLVLDVSASMQGPERFELVERAAELFISNLHPTDRAAIVLFSTEGYTLTGLATGEVLKERWTQFINRIHGSPIFYGSGTYLGAGLSHALAELKLSARTGTARRIYVLTDGELHDAETCEALAREFPEAGVELHIYGFGDDFNPEQLAGVIQGVPGGAVKPLIDRERVEDTFLHLAGVSRRIVARDMKLLVRFATGVIAGDAFRFKPQQRYLGPIMEHQWSDTVPSIEAERTYSYVFELRLPAGEPGVETVGIASTTCERGGTVHHHDLRLEVSRVESTDGCFVIDDIGRAYQVVLGLRDSDPMSQIRALEARIVLCRSEGRDPALIEALEHQLEDTKHHTEEHYSPQDVHSQTTEQDRKYLRCDENSVVIIGLHEMMKELEESEDED